MKTILLIAQFFIASGLIGLILLQNSKGGLQSSMGGTDFYSTKRGAEKIVFRSTIVFGILFFLITVINIFVQ